MVEESKVTYTQGHHESVTKVHASRTAENSAAFLLPHLKPNMNILDVGCGPGSITTTLANYVPEGSVTGVDVADSVLEEARTTAKDLQNVKFKKGNVMDKLPFEDESFDVVFCHQVLFHVTDHVSALKEMRRVCRTGGLVACREGDLGTYIHFPPNEGFHLFLETYHKMIVSAGMSPGTGRQLHSWARLAGFDPKKITKSASATLMASEEERNFFGNLHKDRILKSELNTRFKALGTSEEDLQKMVSGWQEWMDDQDGWLSIMQGEIVCIH